MTHPSQKPIATGASFTLGSGRVVFINQGLAWLVVRRLSDCVSLDNQGLHVRDNLTRSRDGLATAQNG